MSDSATDENFNDNLSLERGEESSKVGAMHYCEGCFLCGVSGCIDSDDGVPPFCRYSLCPLDPRNYLANNNVVVEYLGSIGFEYFDRHRRVNEQMVCTIYLTFAFAT